MKIAGSNSRKTTALSLILAVLLAGGYSNVYQEKAGSLTFYIS